MPTLIPFFWTATIPPRRELALLEHFKLVIKIFVRPLSTFAFEKAAAMSLLSLPCLPRSSLPSKLDVHGLELGLVTGPVVSLSRRARATGRSRTAWMCQLLAPKPIKTPWLMCRRVRMLPPELRLRRHAKIFPRSGRG